MPSNSLQLWCWRRLPMMTSNQSISREINPEYSLKGLLLKLKLQFFYHLMWTRNSLEKSLMLEKIEGRKRSEHQRMRWLDSITDAMDMNLVKLWESWDSWHAAVQRVSKNQTQLGNWTTTTKPKYLFFKQALRCFWCYGPRTSLWVTLN